MHTIPSYPTLSLLSMQTQVRTRERPRHQSSLSSCHSGLCWGGSSRISSSSQLCRQVSGLGLIADKPFVDAWQRAGCLQLRVPGLRIPSTANPQPSSSERPQCRGQEPEAAGGIQGLDSKVNILSLRRMKREHCWCRGAGSLVQLSLQGPNITERFPGFGLFHLEIAGSFL